MRPGGEDGAGTAPRIPGRDDGDGERLTMGAGEAAAERRQPEAGHRPHEGEPGHRADDDVHRRAVTPRPRCCADCSDGHRHEQPHGHYSLREARWNEPDRRGRTETAVAQRAARLPGRVAPQRQRRTTGQDGPQGPAALGRPDGDDGCARSGAGPELDAAAHAQHAPQVAETRWVVERDRDDPRGGQPCRDRPEPDVEHIGDVLVVAAGAPGDQERDDRREQGAGGEAQVDHDRSASSSCAANVCSLTPPTSAAVIAPSRSNT